jgi:hypothetical protein
MKLYSHLNLKVKSYATFFGPFSCPEATFAQNNKYFHSATTPGEHTPTVHIITARITSYLQT